MIGIKKGDIVCGFVCFLIIFIALYLTLPGPIKLLAILLPVILIVLTVSGIIALAIFVIGKKDDKAKEKDDKEKQEFLGGLIRHVPANQQWILKLGMSSSVEPEVDGYWAIKEGWWGYIPYLFIDMGFVDLSPIQRSPQTVQVLSRDGQPAFVDWMATSTINNAILYAVKVGNNDDKRKGFEFEQIVAAITRVCSEQSQIELITIGEGIKGKEIEDELKQMSESITSKANEFLESLRIGIKVEVRIQNIAGSEGVRQAAEYQTTAELRNKVAETRGNELKTIIETTRADATEVVKADLLRETVERFTEGGMNLVVKAMETFGKKNKQDKKEEEKK